MRPSARPSAALAVAAFFLAACSGGGASTAPTLEPASEAPSAAPSVEASPAPSEGLSGTLTIYSGRSEELVGPLVEQFESESGLEIQVNYAGTTDLAATLLEEGNASPADVFFAQDAGALGAVGEAGLLAPLPADTLAEVDSRFVSDNGQWVGVSGRARVVIYDTRVFQEADLPDSIDAFTDPAWRGKIGWAPTNASLQSFVTAYRVLRGDEAARAWIEGIVANEPKVYEGNDAVLASVAAGEVEVGFVNHYYLMRQLAEQGESFPVRNHFLAGDDPGSLINVAGAGILATAPNPGAGLAFVNFLLSPEAQEYFATETHEYPLIDGVDANPALPALGDIESPDLDLSNLADLQGTLDMLTEAGAL